MVSCQQNSKQFNIIDEIFTCSRDKFKNCQDCRSYFTYPTPSIIFYLLIHAQLNIINQFGQVIQLTMRSPKLNKNKKSNSIGHEKEVQQQQNGQQHSHRQSVEIKPWNSSRLAKITACITKKTGNNIFSLSNRSSNSNTKANGHQGEKEGPKTYSFKSYHKPRTAPHNPSWKRKQINNHLSQQIVRLGPVVTQQVLDNHFEENLQSINFYPQFRASVQQRKNLFLLKPYIKSNNRQRKQFNLSTFEGIQKLKTELYKGLKESQNAYIESENQNIKSIQSLNNGVNNGGVIGQKTTRSSVIEYMTEYGGEIERESMVGSGRVNSRGRYKNSSISILREKLKNKYKSSIYGDKIVKIRRGEGVPITIIQ